MSGCALASHTVCYRDKWHLSPSWEEEWEGKAGTGGEVSVTNFQRRKNIFLTDFTDCGQKRREKFGGMTKRLYICIQFVTNNY